MTDGKQPPDDHADRVRVAFDSFTQNLQGPLDDEARSSVERLKQAAAARDAESMRRHLEEMRQRHGWLYRELAAHPGIATLLDELALLGF